MQQQSYKAFVRKIERRALKKRFPMAAVFELTHRCNFRCVHCYNSESQKKARPQDELKTVEVFAILRQLKALGCYYVAFTGGEIFLRKDILKIIVYARQQGFQVGLLTNASLIDGKMAGKLQKLGLNKIDVTVHAMDHDIFDRVTRVRGSARKVFAALEALHQLKVPVVYKTCGLRENKNEWLKVKEFAQARGADHRFSSELLACSDKSREPFLHSLDAAESYAALKACYPQVSRNERSGLPRVDKRGRPRILKGKELFHCGTGKSMVDISPSGELKFCIEMDEPRFDVRKHGLAKAWQMLKDHVDGLEPPEDWCCKTCAAVDHCSWCPAHGYLNKGNVFDCGGPEMRAMAECRKAAADRRPALKRG